MYSPPMVLLRACKFGQVARLVAISFCTSAYGRDLSRTSLYCPVSTKMGSSAKTRITANRCRIKLTQRSYFSSFFAFLLQTWFLMRLICSRVTSHLQSVSNSGLEVNILGGCWLKPKTYTVLLPLGLNLTSFSIPSESPLINMSAWVMRGGKLKLYLS